MFGDALIRVGYPQGVSRIFFAMIGPLQDATGFNAGACRELAQTTEAVAALFTAGGLSLSLLVTLAMLSLDVLRMPGLAL
jgi:hypothetical protein